MIFVRILLALALLPALGLSEPPAARVDFQSDVRPVLSDACFLCHGPDPGTRIADLRLDLEEGVFAERANGTLVVPGDPDHSLLYRRITEKDAARRMPPEYSHKKLEPEQIGNIRAWIEQGAEWTGHWSFEAPKRPEPPAVKNEAWVRNEIDRFISARLDQAGLTPNGEADRRTLARRAALDVTGLPPTAEDLQRFVDDEASNAYENYLDRLFAYESYGEHRARYWLDAARYADTHGIHIDNYREMWPYRDWVINAYNRNLRFDQFTIEQIAGDLLPDPSLDQLVASGFHRCNATTNEGGVIAEEYEVIYAKDRADTTGTVFLGLTVGCATCHDHKFDPIKQKDFYAMTAFFRNTTQFVMDGNVSDPPPVIIVPAKADRELYQKQEQRDRTLARRLETVALASGKSFEKWLSKGKHRAIDAPLGSTDQVLAVGADAELPDGVSIGNGPAENVKALWFGEGSSLSIPGHSLDESKPFSLTMWVHHPEADGSYTVASQSDPDNKFSGWSLGIGQRQLSFRMTAVDESGDDPEANSISIVPNNLRRLTPGEWKHITITYDGSGERAGLSYYYDGRLIPTQGSEFFDDLKGSIVSSRPIELGKGYYRDNGELKSRHMEGGGIADVRIFDRVISVDEARVAANWSLLKTAREKDAAGLTDEEREILRLRYLNLESKKYQTLVAARRENGLAVREVRRRGSVTHVMQEMTDGKPEAHVLFRGMYDQRGDKVAAATPGFLPAMPAGLPNNRLGLAKWIIDESNPLTARVAVNRYWQEVFGTGLVRTTEDFGAQGERPSHPELLDWLAVDFRESGWDSKRLLKNMLMSATYRQSTEAVPDKLEADPANRLLSRGPRFRMDGEQIRDYALAASGIMVGKVGGPSVKPYQPDGVWSGVAMPGSNTRKYEADTGAKLYRRSLYTFWKRSAPPASMVVFNAPTREHTIVRRERTNTPLQALVTMNDTQFVEAARYLAQSAMRSTGGGFVDQLDYMAIRLLARSFDSGEQAVALRTYGRLLDHYRSDAEAARELIETGESEPDADLPIAESAALTMLANQMMNLDEVLNK